MGNIVKRGKRKKANYLLLRENGQQPLAIIEAKDKSHSTGAGMQQALEYAQILGIPFACASNGQALLKMIFYWHRAVLDHGRISF